MGKHFLKTFLFYRSMNHYLCISYLDLRKVLMDLRIKNKEVEIKKDLVEWNRILPLHSVSGKKGDWSGVESS